MSAVTEGLSDAIGRGVFGSRPAAGIAGRLYIATDTSALYRDNGTTWDLITISAAAVFVGCSISGTTTLSAADTALTFQSADTFDTDNFHDPASSNTRITIPALLGGKYLFTAMLQTAAGATDRRLGYKVNGGSNVIRVRQFFGDSSTAQWFGTSFVLDMSAADYIEFTGYSDGGGTAAHNVQASKIG